MRGCCASASENVPPLAFLARESIEAAQQGKTGFDQRGKLAGEERQHLGLDLAPAADLGLVFRDDGGFLPRFIEPLRVETELADLRNGVVLVGGFDGAVGLFAAGIHGGVGEFGHKGAGLGLRFYVYFRTSSIVVSPSKILRRPSARSVVMPSSMAFCRMTTEGARWVISSRIGSVMSSSS